MEDMSLISSYDDLLSYMVRSACLEFFLSEKWSLHCVPCSVVKLQIAVFSTTGQRHTWVRIR